MLGTRDGIQSQLRRLFDAEASVDELEATGLVSPFLAGEFDLYHAIALGEGFVVAACRTVPADPEALASQIPQLSQALGERAVPYLPRLEPADRRSLIEERRDFICENGDAYLPFLGLHLREAAGARVGAHRPFRASDQSTFLFGLYAQRFTANDIMSATGLSSGSVSRALLNMTRARMLDFETGGRTGRLKEYFKPDEQFYYLEGRRLFGKAVVSSTYTDVKPDSTGVPAFVSGLSALGMRSNLQGPDKEVWATWDRHSMRIQASRDIPVSACRYVVQALAYDPAPFATDGLVDPFTMLVTIPNELLEIDERVRIAVRSAMEGCAWYRD